MLRTIAMLTALSVLPQSLETAKDVSTTGLALFLAIVLANIVTKLVEKRNGSSESALLQQLAAGHAADTTAIAALLARMEKTEAVAEERHKALLAAIKVRAA